MDLSSLSVLAAWAPFILIFGGFVSVSMLYGTFRKGAAGNAIKALGFFAGILMLVTGVMVLFGQAERWDIWGLLLVTGLGLVLKPMTRISFSALLGLIVGLTCVGLLYLYFPLPATILGISSLWIYLIVFFIPALIVFLIFKFVEELAKLFGMVLGSWPVLTILGLLCMGQGILLLMNQSLLTFIA